MQIKAIVSLSGGMDSATVLAKALNEGREVMAVAFDYGSKHGPYELAKVRELCHHYSVPHQVLDLKAAMHGFKSALMKQSCQPIPEGHYEHESMKQTVVPGRNIIFASLLAGVAWSNECSEVWMGIHAGDHHIYPDCRPEFYTAMREAVYYGTDKRVSLFAPFLYENKGDILKKGLELKVPYHFTRTCYQPQVLACGKCGSCTERLEAFKLNNATDPVPYASLKEKKDA